MAGVTRSELMQIFRALCREVLPEVAGIPYHTRARVVKARGGSVDVRLLAKDGSVDAKAPVLPGIRLPSGVGQVKVGTEVRVGFYYNDPSQPFIDAALGE